MKTLTSLQAQLQLGSASDPHPPGTDLPFEVPKHHTDEEKTSDEALPPF